MNQPVRVNLLPDSIRARRLRPGRIRGWIAAAALTLMVAFIGWQVGHRRSGDVVDARRQLAKYVSQTRQEQKRRAVLHTEAAALNRDVSVLSAMRAPVSWSTQLEHIARSLPPASVLVRVNLSSQPIEPSTAGPTAQPPNAQSPQAAAPIDPPRWSHQLNIEGYAADHADIASILRRLEDTGLFTGVRLVRSARENVGAAPVLSFAIACQR